MNSNASRISWPIVFARCNMSPILARIRPDAARPLAVLTGCVPRTEFFAEHTLVGVKLAARAFHNQQVEALVKCRVLNRMASLGLPSSEQILLG